MALSIMQELEENSSLSLEDVEEVVKEMFGQPKVEEEVNEKVQATRNVGTETAQKPVNPNNDFVDWDAFEQAHEMA